MKGIYTVLFLALLAAASASANDESDVHWDDADYYYLAMDTYFPEELWFLETEGESSLNMSSFCDILLPICVDLRLTDDDLFNILPDIWELDCESCLLWEGK